MLGENGTLTGTPCKCWISNYVLLFLSSSLPYKDKALFHYFRFHIDNSWSRIISRMLVQWADHQQQLVNRLTSLLTSHTMLDITLAAEGRFIKAHKVILAASSKYFEVSQTKLLQVGVSISTSGFTEFKLRHTTSNIFPLCVILRFRKPCGLYLQRQHSCAW